jgi:glycosyltransferase involved in cell wall biosynthesis
MYNEEQAVAPFFARLLPVLESLGEDYEIICVNDGSDDATLEGLLAAQKRHRNVRVADLSRNYGKEAAITAGIDLARGAAVVPIDADLQDPPEVIPRLVARWRDGFEVVLARRASRRSDGWLKKAASAWFFRVHNRVSDVVLPAEVGDFRLMDRAVIEAVRRLPERHRLMKGLFAWVGFRTATVEYERAARGSGASKFSGWKLWNLGVEGVTSFSTLPLRIWTYLGVVVAVLSLLYGVFIVVRTLLQGVDVPGYASVLTAVIFLGGVQLIGLGVIGEYLGRVYTESKQRPVYLVRKLYE